MKNDSNIFHDGCVPGHSIRTDLAVEAQEIVREKTAGEIPGVEAETVDEDGITTTRVRINSREGSESLGKPIGNYVTMEAPSLRQRESKVQENLSRILSRELTEIAEGLEKPGRSGKTSVLVVGLGNWNVTPDSLGPRVVEDILVTRHIFKIKEQNGGSFSNEEYGDVSAFTPGVMGLTGIETADIIRGITNMVNPDLIIAIDALAAFRLERLHTTVQIADVGIVPGSGVHNKRMEISQDTLGVPVIAIGVPTVVEASTIAGFAMDALIKAINADPGGASLGKALDKFNEAEKKQLMQELFGSFTGQLMVTPKEIDAFIDEIAISLAGGINSFLHPALDEKESGKYLQ